MTLFFKKKSSVHFCLDIEAKSIFSVLQQSYIPVSVQVQSRTEAAVEEGEGGAGIINPGQEPDTSDIDTFEGDKLKKILQRSAIKSDLSDEEDSEDSERSLVIPLLALSAIAGLTLGLAGFRLFYSRFCQDKQQSRHSHRSEGGGRSRKPDSRKIESHDCRDADIKYYCCSKKCKKRDWLLHKQVCGYSIMIRP